MVGRAISMWPDVIPGRLSIWDAAAPESSQIFMLVGSAILVPMILSYTGGRIGCSAAKSMRRVIIEQFNACAIMETPALVCCDLGGKRPDPEPCGRAHQAGFEAMTGEAHSA